jgi:hypothetical protein
VKRDDDKDWVVPEDLDEVNYMRCFACCLAKIIFFPLAMVQTERMVMFLKRSSQAMQHRCGVELLRTVLSEGSKVNDDRILPALKDFLTQKSKDSPNLQVSTQTCLHNTASQHDAYFFTWICVSGHERPFLPCTNMAPLINCIIGIMEAHVPGMYSSVF